MKEKISFYEKRITLKKIEMRKLNKNYNIISFLRILTIISLVFFIYYCFINNNRFIGFMLIVLHTMLFLFLIKAHEHIAISKQIAEDFIELNEKEVKRIEGTWKEFNDDGSEYLDVNHPFINDLDIFGKNSLFQWINNTKTLYGREKLKDLLMIRKLPSKNQIIKRQESLKELGNKIDFRQTLTSVLKTNKNKNYETFISSWVKEEKKGISLFLNFISIAMPIVNIVIIILVILNIVTWRSIIFSLAISFCLLKLIDNNVKEGLIIFEDLKYKIKSYVKAIKIIQDEDFEGEELNILKSKLKNNESLASDNLLELEKVTSWLYDRHNAFYIIFNCLFLWDYQIIKKLEKWRLKNKDSFDEYMEVLGEFEAMSCLSSLVFNNPSWKIPSISDDVLSGIEVIHPLLGSEAISNSFYMNKEKRVLLITGSNMSGKSTFLRTIGFNIVLSYLGVSVPSNKFVTPIFKLYTCMRTGDNLEENISSFYSEILRVKSIVDASKKNEKIFFLLDEIFKGTNSVDRHEGARVLINQLLKTDSMGIVSTHDLELCQMANNNKKIVNYHFKEYYKENKIMFDYKIRDGVSTTRNAKYLMKMAGINIE